MPRSLCNPVFSSMSFMTSDLKFLFLIHLELNNTMKLLKANIFDTNSSNILLKSFSQGKIIKSKNKQMEQKLLHSKEIHQQNNMTTYRMGEDIHKWWCDNKLISKT